MPWRRLSGLQTHGDSALALWVSNYYGIMSEYYYVATTRNLIVGLSLFGETSETSNYSSNKFVKHGKI